MNQPDSLQRILMHAVEDHGSMKRTFDNMGAQTLKFGMPEAARTAHSRMQAKLLQGRIHGFLKATGHLCSRFPHVSQSPQRKVFPKVIGLLQGETHPRFSSRMMRSTMARISSEE